MIFTTRDFFTGRSEDRKTRVFGGLPARPCAEPDTVSCGTFRFTNPKNLPIFRSSCKKISGDLVRLGAFRIGEVVS
jgi:hypothetical protein